MAGALRDAAGDRRRIGPRLNREAIKAAKAMIFPEQVRATKKQRIEIDIEYVNSIY